jgi:hypothetical protein
MALFHIGPGRIIHRYLFLKLTAERGDGKLEPMRQQKKSVGFFSYILFNPYTVRNTLKIIEVFCLALGCTSATTCPRTS